MTLFKLHLNMFFYIYIQILFDLLIKKNVHLPNI